MNHLLGKHPRMVVAAMAVSLGGFGVAAFGVAPLAADHMPVVQRVLTESIEPSGLEAQAEALAQQVLELARSETTRSSDSADALLSRLGVRDSSAVTFVRNDPIARRLFQGRAGKSVRARVDGQGNLVELVARYPAENSEQINTHFSRLRVAFVGGQWTAGVEQAALVPQARLGSGSIRSSLFAATDEAKLPDAVASQLAEIFSTDIDFHRELRKGDSFSVVYEAMVADDEPAAWAGAGRVLAAEFVNQGKSHQAVWFAAPNGRGAYFDFSGQSKRRAFLASPMEFSRVTSGFAMRMHPLLQRWQAHLGVDYGAPMGTPVRVVGEGVVEFAGRQNGYGNVIEVRHGKERSTLYAHLSRIDVKKGQRVDQGQHIGAVGATGWATGPHLHFEFRVNGKHQDPLRLAKAAETMALEPSAKPLFAQTLTRVKSQLDLAETTVSQGARFE